MIVRALQDENVDALVWRATGQGSGAVERVLVANPGLGEIAIALPEHTPVTIPELPATAAELQIVQLWD
jgi:phage tail protein X